jgi:hypothetical protein
MGLFDKLFRAAASSNLPSHPPLPLGVESFAADKAVAAFRASVNAAGTDPKTGERVFRAGTATSTISSTDAEQQARVVAERHLQAAFAGSSARETEYAYAVDRRLEPIVETLAHGGIAAARVTVNSYGALVVNARAVLFSDVDTRPSDDAEDDPAANDRAAARLNAVVAADPRLGFRVYRTRNGWRYLCTSQLYDPAGDDTRALLEALGADAKYVLLCRVQKCFRARLTPKPWRIGHRFSEVGPLQSVSRRRLESYLRKAAPFASARFAAAIGQTEVMPDPEVRLVIDYHDRWCAADSEKPLA